MGERYKWCDLVQKYPGKWLVLEDCTYNGASIEDCILVAVLDDSEVFEHERKNVDKDYQYERTTDGHYSGVINLENADITVR